MEKGRTKVLIVLLIIVIIAAGGTLAYKLVKDKNKTQEVTGEENETPIIMKEEKKIKIFSGNDRPIAVMIDNHSDAWPQAGLQDAYMVYEIIVEGGETRLMALFKGADVDKIGPVRSARHYFIDYAMENDAIYTHFGQSPQAASDIKKYNINDINGIAEDGTTFWRVKDKAAPHNAVTSTKKLLESAQSKKYKTTSTKESVLKYTTDEVNLENGQGAVSVTIPHSNLQTVKYVYNEESKVYERYARKKEQKENLYTKDEFIKIVESTTKELIELTNLKPNNIRIRDISYAWGSCSTNKNITISLKLIKYSKEAIKYVILHELCHLKYMNHSKNFWNLVEKYMPDYKEIKKSLNNM